MRILYHHRTLGDGAEGIHIREMVKAFRGLGHEVVVAGPVGESQKSCVGRQSGLMSKIKRRLPSFCFELLEVAYPFFCFLDLCTKAAGGGRPDFIYDRYITFNFGAVWAARLVNIPVVLEVNAPLALERSNEPDEKLFLRKLAHRIERYVCGNADRTVVVSTPLKEYLESVGVPAGRCTVMPNGVDVAKFCRTPKKRALLERLQIPKDAVVIGFTGILRAWHGMEILIEAVGTLNDRGMPVYLLIVGDGPVREHLETLLRDTGLAARSLVTGLVRHEEIPDYVNLFDIAVSPKATFYASPMKVVEYMALGKAVVTPDSRNFKDLIEDGVTGFHFCADSVSSLADCLDRLSGDRSLRERVGERARERVETRLNWGLNAEEVCRLVLAQKS